MQLTLKNQGYTVTIESLGAELKSAGKCDPVFGFCFVFHIYIADKTMLGHLVFFAVAPTT